jgi:myo-inositol-1(or 4)-monophosphatase
VNAVPYDDDLELALAAARAAGPAIMAAFRTNQEVTYKSADQPLTAADLEANRIIHEHLVGARPEYGWLSEETIDNPARLERERVWIVDPIDGTRSFVAGRPEFAISIALAVAGEVVLGVIANPATGETFWAVRGAGAYGLPDRPLRVRPHAGSATTLLAASRSELKRGEFALFTGDWEFLPVGSTAYKLAKVASGAADAFLSRGPKSEWDVAAGDLIVREAGGRVTDLKGGTLHYNRPDPYIHGVLATSGPWHDDVLARARQIEPTGRLRGDDAG